MSFFSFSRFNTKENIRSEKLVSSTLSDCTLKVLFNAERFCYCIINADNEILAISDFQLKPTANPLYLNEKDIIDFFKEEELLQNEFTNIVVAYQSRYSCIVADLLNDEDSAAANLALCVPDLPNDEAYTVETTYFHANHSLIYALPLAHKEALHSAIKQPFEITSAFAHFTKQHLGITTIFSPKKMHLNFYENNCEIVVTEGTSLLHINSFTNITEKEFLFSVFSVAKTTQFDFEKENIYLTGFYNNNEVNFYELLSNYSKRCELEAYPSKYVMPEVIANIYSPYFNLICL